MAPSRKPAINKSPLVNKQHQITSFFSKSSLKPSINPNFSTIPKSQNPNPNSSPPTTPSPLNGKSRPKSMPKSVLMIGSQKELEEKTVLNSFGEEIVSRRVRVYWPLDKTWYEGHVKSYDKCLRKHLVEYDDGDEELIDLSKEKFEFVQKKFRRLRKVSMAVENEDDVEIEEEKGNVVEEDDSSDEDWGKDVNVAVEIEEEEEEEEEEDEEELVDEVEDEKAVRLKRKREESRVEDAVDISKKKKKKKDGFLVSDFGAKVENVVASVQGN